MRWADMGQNRKGVVGEVDLSGFGILLVHREVHDPREGEAVGVGETELVADDDDEPVDAPGGVRQPVEIPQQLIQRADGYEYSVATVDWHMAEESGVV